MLKQQSLLLSLAYLPLILGYRRTRQILFCYSCSMFVSFFFFKHTGKFKSTLTVTYCLTRTDSILLYPLKKEVCVNVTNTSSLQRLCSFKQPGCLCNAC